MKNVINSVVDALNGKARQTVRTKPAMPNRPKGHLLQLDGSTCAGCGATTTTAKEMDVKGGGRDFFCKPCRTTKGHAFLSIPKGVGK